MKQQPLFSLFGIFFLLSFLSGCATWEGGNASLRNFRTIILDPGHGGFDHGARSVRGLDEKGLNLDIAKRVRPYLKHQGYHVIMTRDKDIFIPLGTRARISNAHPDAVFVSIHCNWATRRAAKGIEVYHYARNSELFASQVLKEILPAYHTSSRGVKYARFYVLRHNERPSILIEVGFISNYQDNRSLQDPRTRDILARDIARGITIHHAPLHSSQRDFEEETTAVPSSSTIKSSSDVVSSSSKHMIWEEAPSPTSTTKPTESRGSSSLHKTVTRRRSSLQQSKNSSPPKKTVVKKLTISNSPTHPTSSSKTSPTNSTNSTKSRTKTSSTSPKTTTSTHTTSGTRRRVLSRSKTKRQSATKTTHKTS